MSSIARWLQSVAWVAGAKTYVARLAVQLVFALVVIQIGLRFAWFVESAMAASTPSGVIGSEGFDWDLPNRPGGVEAFLPISGLLGLADWVFRGRLNDVHPAATVLLVLFLALALLGRKAFCSWVCPVGLLSETLARIGRAVFGRNLRLWRFVDVPARGLKYLLLAFFLTAILMMGPESIRSFIESPYNRLADVKMYLFFAEPSRTTLITLGVLFLGSIAINGLWCRYLCPYGALLGLFSWLSPLKVRRDHERCTGCGACDKACWARLQVSRKRAIASVECSACLDCLASCKSPGALRFGLRESSIKAASFGAAVVVFVMTGCLVAQLAGLWHTAISDAEYVLLLLHVDAFSHP